ncbi:uncharacterized protein LOC114286171 [Camellia sinensis]|uniref:uncharacterized protein LOC114286171 n=1 Tax=Camellia sinensis TaxID=4442 RepID=UPI0010358BF4|nr:uncharacterized protein LOC114286171 [Camellia sinensis]
MPSKSGSGQRLLNEAEASLQIGQVLGLNCEGNEGEVISKLMEVEAQYKEMMRRRGGDAETKKSSINEEFVRLIWPGEKMEFMAVYSDGVVGGLLCIWNPDVFQMLDCYSNKNFIILSVLEEEWCGDSIRRRMVWDSLIRLNQVYDKPWCLGGDFNEIKCLSEKKGCSRRDRSVREFNELIDNLEVCDLPMMRRKFTWCNSQDGGKWSRIDRFLLSPEWIHKFNFKPWGLPRRISDHCPILLMEDERDWGPKPFFLNAWSLHPSFLAFVEKIWAETTVLLEEELHRLDLAAEERSLTESKLTRRRKKSKTNWALKEDRNTKIFHVMASSRSNKNALNSITVDGVIKEDPAVVRAEVLQHFKNQFIEYWSNRPSLFGPFKSIGGVEVRATLEAEFSEAKIVAVVKNCDGNKAPGLDGFNMMMF